MKRTTMVKASKNQDAALTNTQTLKTRAKSQNNGNKTKRKNKQRTTRMGKNEILMKSANLVIIF